MTRFKYTEFRVADFILLQKSLAFRIILHFREYFDHPIKPFEEVCSKGMFKSLHCVQSGFLSPQIFIQNEITKRCCTLQLSRHQDVESVHTAGVNTLDIEKLENRYLLSGCGDGSLYIHDVNNMTGQPYYTAKCICKVVKNNSDAHRHSVESVSWYGTDNALFITSGTDRNLKIWDANSLKSIEKFHLKGKIFHHECSTFPTPSPIIAVAGSVNHVELIDLRTGGAIHELRGHSSSVISCTWSPTEEHLLATGGIDKKILLWDIRSSNCCLKQLDKDNKSNNKSTAHTGYVNGLKFTTDGLFLVSFGTDNKLRLWETANGYNQNIEYAKIKNNVKKNVQFSISYNSKPSLLYVPSEGNIYIFEILSGRLINVLNGHFHSVNCCFYRGVYQELYSGGNDRNILLWSADESQEGASLEINEVENNSCTGNNFQNSEDAWSSQSSNEN